MGCFSEGKDISRIVNVGGGPTMVGFIATENFFKFYSLDWLKMHLSD